MKTIKSILTLMVLPTILSELATGGTLLSNYLTPVRFLLLIAVYLPVLLIREFSFRYKLGYGGILFLGAIYGFFNEGLVAKTMIVNNTIPFAPYNHYGYIAGISLPWTLLIAFWHAISSVL